MKKLNSTGKRTLSWVLVLAMVMTLMPIVSIPSLAAGPTPTRTSALDFITNADIVYNRSSGLVTGNPTVGNITDSTEGWKWYLTAADTYSAKTLVLDGFHLAASDKPDTLKVPAGTTIVLINSNSVTNTKNYTDTYSNGIYVGGVLNITGEGSLAVEVINGTSSGSNNANGIYADNGTITIDGGAIITTAANTRGISTDMGGNIIVSGTDTSLTATGRNAFSGGIRTEEEDGSLLSVTLGATVVATGAYYGIYAGSLTVDETSTLTSMGSTQAFIKLSNDGAITLTGVVVKAGANAGSAVNVDGTQANLTSTANKYVNIAKAEASATKKAIDAWIATANGGGALTGLTVTDTDANTVTVTGTAGQTATTVLELTIPAGITVDWKATLENSTQNNAVRLFSGSLGTFEVSTGGSITASYSSVANGILNSGAATINITGGTVIGSNHGIDIQGAGSTNVSAGRVSTSGTTRYKFGINSRGAITVSGTAMVEGGIYCNGAVAVSAGAVVNAKGPAVEFQQSGSSLTLSGTGLLFGKTAAVVNAAFTPTDDAIAISWAANASSYMKSTSTDLTVLQANGKSAAAVWDTSGSDSGVTYTRAGSDTTGFIAISGITAGDPPAITGVSAGTTTIAATGGTSVITVAGTDLIDGIKVTAFDGASATAITGTTTGNSTSQTVTLTFPSNPSSAGVKAYTIKASLDSGSNWDNQTAAVSVSAAPAAAGYTLYFKNGNLYEGNTATVYTGNGGKWSVSGSQLILLDGFNFNTTADTALFLSDTSIIDVTGTAAITAAPGSPVSSAIYGIKTEMTESLTIQGTGTLNLTCTGSNTAGVINGINVPTSTASLTIADSVTVNADTSGASGTSRNSGVYLTGKLILSGSATLNATSGTTSSANLGLESSGLFAGCIITTGTASTAAQGGAAASSNSYGIYISDSVSPLTQSSIASTSSVTGAAGSGFGAYAFGFTDANPPTTIKPQYGGAPTDGTWQKDPGANRQYSVQIDGSTPITSGKLVNKPAPTGNTVTLTVNKDGAPWTAHGRVFKLYQGYTEMYSGTGADGTVAFTSVADGTYDIYVGTTVDTGIDVTIAGASQTATLNYITVAFAVANSGTAAGSTIKAQSGGTTGFSSPVYFLSGSSVTITATGQGTGPYTYAWTGTGTSGQTTAAITINPLTTAVSALCTVTGGSAPSTYTLTVTAGTDGTASGSASLAQGATTTITANPNANYSFSHWTVSGAGSSVTNANSASTTFTMGNANATATANFTYNPPYNPGDGGYTPAPDPKVPVIIDGKEYNIGQISTSGNTAAVSVDQTELNKQISNAKESIIIPISTSARTVVAQLVVKNIEDISARNMTLSVKVGNIVYELPADSVDTKALMEQFTASDSAKVQLSISITNTVDAAAKDKVDAAAKNLGAEIIIPAIQFGITATYNGKTVEVKTFDSYVPRTVEITAEQAAKITTAIVVEADGTTRHVPTRVYQKDGKWYAEINSRTNSTYVLIYNNKSFTDAKDTWYEKAVNEMVSRKIMLGVGNNNFAGDRAITRAEFATIVVNALGLPATGNGGVFTDVLKTNAHYGAIGTAYEYGIVCGIGNNKYHPGANITWQEAMTMLCRASEVAGYKLTAGSYENYSDASDVSEWAKEFVSFYAGAGLFIHDGKLRLKANITRGETAVAVLTMLQKAKLIDVR